MPSQDTSKSRRALAGFDSENTIESFGISPDGERITLAGRENLTSITLAEQVPRVTPVRVNR